jgi:hypothetical protein
MQLVQVTVDVLDLAEEPLSPVLWEIRVFPSNEAPVAIHETLHFLQI